MQSTMLQKVIYCVTITMKLQSGQPATMVHSFHNYKDAEEFSNMHLNNFPDDTLEILPSVLV